MPATCAIRPIREGWHRLYDVDGPGFRRARRIDVTRDAPA
jgi:hypothetical protein